MVYVQKKKHIYWIRSVVHERKPLLAKVTNQTVRSNNSHNHKLTLT